MIAVFLLSIIFTSAIAGVISLGALFISQELASATFFIVLGVQWLIMQPINRLLTMKQEELTAKNLKKFQELEELDLKQVAILDCAYCGTKNGVQVDINAETLFSCTKCKNKNSVIVQYMTTRVTDPILTDLNNTNSKIYDTLDKIMNDDDEVSNG